MEVKKFSELDQKKKWIVLAVAILVLILLLLLLLRSCGCDNSDNNDGDSTTTTTSSPADDDDGDDSSTVSTFDAEDIGYDEELVSTWYMDVTAMVLNEDGTGSLYYGDEDGGEIQWYTVDNYLTLVTAEKTSVVTYVVSGDDLTLTYSNGQVESWFR